MSGRAAMNDITELPQVVEVPDQPCQQLYEGNPVLLGYDVVAYHFIPSYWDGGVPVQGLSEFAWNFHGYQFWFANETNRNLFINDPWRYAPAWGGFCSWGIALERKPSWPWETDYLGPPASPWTGWMIYNNTLLFNIWATYSEQFLMNADENVQLAIERWTDWWGDIHAGPFNTHCIGEGPLKNWCLAQQPSPWLEPLPDCEESECNETNCTAGGVVSDKTKFNDFENDRYSPHQQRLIKALSISGFVLVLLIAVGSCLIHRRRKKIRASKQGEVEPSDSDDTPDTEE